MLKFLLRYIGCVVLFAVFTYSIMIIVSIIQLQQTIRAVDVQAQAALEAAVRSSQSSTDDLVSFSNNGTTIQTQNIKYYKYYFDNASTLSYSQDFKDFLNVAYGGDVGLDSYFRANLSTDVAREVGLTPADFAVPFIQLAPTSESSSHKDSVSIPRLDGTGVETQQFDSDVCSKVDQYLTASIASSQNKFIGIIDTANNTRGVPDITVELTDTHNTQAKCIKMISSSASSIIGALGPIYTGNNASNYLTGVSEILYYDIEVKVKYNVRITIPLLGGIISDQPVERVYLTRYSLLN